MNNKLKFFNHLMTGGNKRLMVISTQTSTITRKAKEQKTIQKTLLLYLYSVYRISKQDDKKYYPQFFLEECVYEEKKREKKKSHIKSK